MRGLQEEVAEKIDAGLRAAPAKEGGRVYDEPSPSATPRAATWSAPLTQAGLAAERAPPRSRAAQHGTVRGNGARDAVVDRQSTRFGRYGQLGRSRLDSAKRHSDD